MDGVIFKHLSGSHMKRKLDLSLKIIEFENARMCIRFKLSLLTLCGYSFLKME